MTGLTPAGWIFMLGSIGFVTGLTIFCFARVFRRPATADHLHAPLEIEAARHDDR